jgi:hypothetical protein
MSEMVWWLLICILSFILAVLLSVKYVGSCKYCKSTDIKHLSDGVVDVFICENCGKRL